MLWKDLCYKSPRLVKKIISNLKKSKYIKLKFEYKAFPAWGIKVKL